MTSKPVLQRLIEQFPLATIEPYGSVIKIPGEAWEPDWEAELNAVNEVVEEYSELRGDGPEKVAFVLVTLTVGQTTWAQQLKKGERSDIVYVPKADANVVIGGEKVEKPEIKRGSGCRRGPDWGLEQIALLSQLWEAKKSLPKEKRAAELAKMPEFTGRSANGILQKAYWLTGKPKTSKEAKSTPKTDSPKWNGEFGEKCNLPIDCVDCDIVECPGNIVECPGRDSEVPRRNENIEQKLKILSDAYDTLSKSYVELRTNFEKEKKGVENLFEAVGRATSLSGEIDDLNAKLAKHKHAVTGEVMLPMEASS